MFDDRYPATDLRGTDQELQMQIMQTGLETQDLIIGIRQPPPYSAGALTLGVKLSEITVRQLRDLLRRHHVLPRHARLILDFYKALMQASEQLLEPPARIHARVFLVQAIRPSPELPTEAQDA